MRRTNCLLLLGLSIAAGCSTTPETPIPQPEMPATGDTVALPDDPYRQFDFWVGEWVVRNLQLDGGDWEHVGDAVARVHSVVEGRAVLEQWNGELAGNSLIGVSLRAYDPALDRWAIWLNWHGGRPDGFSVMHGSRNGERIEQFPPGDTGSIRYSFSEAREGSCQWDQAQSQDAGATWFTNWVMQFTRRGPAQSLDASNAPIVRPPAAAATFENTRALDGLLGVWQGATRVRRTDGIVASERVRMRVTSMLEGFGLLQFLDVGAGDEALAVERTMTALGFDSSVGGWIAIRADDSPAGLRRMVLEPKSAPRDVTFTTTEAPWLREGWRCVGDDACTWWRRTSADGKSWNLVLEAELTRATE